MSTDSSNAFLLNRTSQKRLRAGISWPKRSRARQWLTAACLISWGSFWATPSPAREPRCSERHPGGNTEGRGQPPLPLRLVGAHPCCKRRARGSAASAGEGGEAQHLAEMLLLSGIMSVQGLNCQLRFGAGTEVIHCFCVAVFKLSSYLQQS